MPKQWHRRWPCRTCVQWPRSNGELWVKDGLGAFRNAIALEPAYREHAAPAWLHNSV
jgi:hypothetical protein